MRSENISPRPASTELAIIGAGPAGALLALSAAQTGFKVTLIDARQTEATGVDGRNYAIVRGSWRLLESLGLTKKLTSGLTPLNGLEARERVSYGLSAPFALFQTEDLPTSETGLPLGYMIEAKALQVALDEALAESPALDWRRATRLEHLEVGPAGVTLTLDTGELLEAALVAGCDGVNSGVRKFADIAVQTHAYKTSVLAANVTLERPHAGIARQIFTPEGPFATLPLAGNRANLAWYLPSSAAQTLARLPKEDIEAELNSRFESFAGHMQIDSPVYTYPLHLMIAEAMIAPRIALVGDAARRINPLAGQGLNLAFKDVAALVEVLEEARYSGLDIGALTVLETYQQWRRFDATATALGMDMIDRLFSNDQPLLKPIRRLALGLPNHFKPLRRLLARQASADQSHLPRRMRP